jgi:hypothetical protein
VGKRAEGGTNWVVVGLIIALLVLVFYTVVSRDIFGFFGSTTSTALFEQKLKLCAAKGAQSALLPAGQRPSDKDSDGNPDSCDYCQGGRDNVDRNPADGIPDDCQPAGVLFKSGDSLEKACNAALACQSGPKKGKCWSKDQKVCILK